MEIKILWSDSALTQLEEIFDYHRNIAGVAVAKKLVKSLVLKSKMLELNPFLGPKEPLLSGRSFEYRYLVERNYKIVYRFNDNFIRINMVFDCRQNPSNLEEVID